MNKLVVIMVVFIFVYCINDNYYSCQFYFKVSFYVVFFSRIELFDVVMSFSKVYIYYNYNYIVCLKYN